MRLWIDDINFHLARAIRALGELGQEFPAAAKALSAVLRDSDAELRREAAEMLGQIGPNARAAVAPLLRALKDPDDDVRSWASLALGSIGPTAAPALLQALQQRSSRVHSGALQALGEIDLTDLDGRALPLVVKALGHRDPAVRLLAARALCQIGPRAKTACPALIKALHDQEETVRLWAVSALAAQGRAARKATSQLLPLLMDREPRMREAALHALQKIDPEITPRSV